MPRKSSRKLNLKKYVREEFVTIPLRVPQSQYAFLDALCKITNQNLPEQVALLLTDWVMPSVEAALHEHQTTTDQPPSSTTEMPVKGPGSKRAINQIVESSVLHGGQKGDLPRQAPPAVSAESAGRQRVVNPAVNDPTRTEMSRSQQPTNSVVANPSRPPQAPIMPPSAVPQPIPPLNRGEPLPSTPPRPVIPPSARPSSGDAERSESAADSTSKTRGANE